MADQAKTWDDLIDAAVQQEYRSLRIHIIDTGTLPSFYLVSYLESYSLRYPSFISLCTCGHEKSLSLLTNMRFDLFLILSSLAILAGPAVGLGLFRGSRYMRELQLAAELNLDPRSLSKKNTVHSVLAKANTQIEKVTTEYITVCLCLPFSYVLAS